jgi:hypothetical protein
MRAALPHPTTERLARSSLTLFEAFEAGLSLYWITPDEVVCVPQPSLSLEDGWLHRSDGPAVRWQTGEAYCFWWGTPIPAWAIAQPERLSVAAIHAEQDLDVRRALIEIYGLQRYFDDTKARRVRADDHCRLWEVSAGGRDVARGRGRKRAIFAATAKNSAVEPYALDRTSARSILHSTPKTSPVR